MTSLKYSVLMSVYKKDKAEYLSESINSILKQTVLPDQIVVVKDGELTRELDEVVETFCQEYADMFTIVTLPQNGGLGYALNEGLKCCKNELVARMDADDISLPMRCEKELEMFEQNPELVICGCNLNEFYGSPENVQTSRVVPESYEEILSYMKKRQPFNHPTVMYKKSCVLEVGGYEKLKRKEDFDLFSRMIMQGYYAKNIGESLYLYRANEDNYKRRKSYTNFKSAVYVYWRHYSRGGCSLGDLAVITMAELVFFIMPTVIVKKLSDTFLRTQM